MRTIADVLYFFSARCYADYIPSLAQYKLRQVDRRKHASLSVDIARRNGEDSSRTRWNRVIRGALRRTGGCPICAKLLGVRWHIGIKIDAHGKDRDQYCTVQQRVRRRPLHMHDIRKSPVRPLARGGIIGTWFSKVAVVTGNPLLENMMDSVVMDPSVVYCVVLKPSGYP